jgi:hypothetical protein
VKEIHSLVVHLKAFIPSFIYPNINIVLKSGEKSCKIQIKTKYKKMHYNFDTVLKEKIAPTKYSAVLIIRDPVTHAVDYLWSHNVSNT